MYNSLEKNQTKKKRKKKRKSQNTGSLMQNNSEININIRK